MRLLVTETGELREFLDSPPPYAILSHRWRDEEVTLQDHSLPHVKSMNGYSKLSKACEVARGLGFEYLWMDTCCIDKTSSAELSEAINSMYTWYTESVICLAYLDDIRPGFDLEDFSKSQWFYRGWTLQELIAPAEVLFFSKNWSLLGTRVSLSARIMAVTGIDEEFLISRNIDNVSAATKMAWASKRVTTRVEDEAYCLLGLFDVNMPTIYGEGNKAFIRLQEEILRKSNDHSIFAWGHRERSVPANELARASLSQSTALTRRVISLIDANDGARVGLMAKSPSEFKEGAEISQIPFNKFELILGVKSLDMAIISTSKGIRINLPMKPMKRNRKIYYIAYLACGIGNGDRLQLLAILLELIGHHIYTRIPGTGSAALLETPYGDIAPSEVHVDDQAYIIRETRYAKRSATGVPIDITGLHTFCKKFDFRISAHYKWSGMNNRWTKQPLHVTGCSFNATVETEESFYLIIRHNSLKLGLAMVLGIEPIRYAKEEKHIFYVHMCPFGKGKGCIPYRKGRNSFQKTLDSWKHKEDFRLAKSIASNVTLPNGLSVISTIMCDTVSPTGSSHPSSDPSSKGFSYKLSVLPIKTA
ncbi:hypothetical protein FQN54_006632 [Arachnomyces sp. PD_36]|nr:hypothetical protein FQN54_006632 [Arachnomyces sp. PD_36]